MACPKSKCADFPLYELVMYHLVDVYRRVGSDLGYMSILISTGLAESVVRYCCLCTVVFYNHVTFAMQENIEQRYAIKFCVKLNKSTTETFASLTLRRLMSYIYGAPILDVSRSHTTTQHSR